MAEQDAGTTASGGTTGQSSSSGSQQSQGAGSAQGNTSQGTTQSSTGQQQTAATRPDWLPESHWDATANAIKPEFGQHFKDLTAFKATEDSRRLTLPQKPEEYDFVLPKDFKPPEGIEFKLNPDDPLAAQARAFALKHGMSKEGFSELLSLYASGQISSEQGIANAKKAEVDKLGVNGVARKTAVDTFIASVPGVSEQMAQVFSKFTFTAAQVEVMEKVMAHMRSQGQGRVTNLGGEPPATTGALPPEVVDKMSPAEKLDYARKFPQERMPAWRDPRGQAA